MMRTPRSSIPIALSLSLLCHEDGFKAIAVRDLAKYVDWRQKPDDPWKIIEERKRELPRLPGR